MPIDKEDLLLAKNSPWYVTDEKFHTYWIWHGLLSSNESIRNDKNSDSSQKQSSYLKKQIILTYFKNFFLFPVWLLKLITPWYFKGENNALTNLKTIIRSKEFKPLRFAIISQIVFLFILAYLGYVAFYKYSKLTKAVESGTVTSTVSGLENIEYIVVPSAESYAKLQEVRKQIYLADQNIATLDKMSKEVNQNFDYNQIVSSISFSEDSLKSLESKMNILFQEQSVADVNDLFVRIINNKIKRELVLDKLAVNANILLKGQSLAEFTKLQTNTSNQTLQLLNKLLVDGRFDSSAFYFEKVKHVIAASLSINRVYLLDREDLLHKIISGDTEAGQKLVELDKNFQTYLQNDLGIVFNSYTQTDSLNFVPNADVEKLNDGIVTDSVETKQ